MTEKFDSNAGYLLAGLTIGLLIAMFFAPKSGEGTRAYLSKKVKEGSKQARKKVRELRAHAEDLVGSGKELINEKKEQIAGNWKRLAKTTYRRNRKQKASRPNRTMEVQSWPNMTQPEFVVSDGLSRSCLLSNAGWCRNRNTGRRGHQAMAKCVRLTAA